MIGAHNVKEFCRMRMVGKIQQIDIKVACKVNIFVFSLDNDVISDRIWLSLK